MRTWFGRGKTLQLAVTCCCLSAFVLFGYDQGVFGGILTNEDWLTRFGHPDDTLTGVIVSSYNLGCLLGCITNFFIGERLGRRRAIWFAMGWVIVGATLQASAFTLPHLIVGRIVTGIGTGIKTSTVPMYQSELCSRESRGRLVSAEVLFVGVGIVSAYWFDFGLSYVGGPLAWRLPLAFQMVFAFFVIFIVFGVPESPRWLLNHGNRDEAQQVLGAVFNKDPSDPEIITEMEAIEEAIEIERQNEKSMLSIFKKDKLHTRRRVLLAWLAQFINQVGGINLVVYYITTLLIDNVGIETRLAQILGGCINTMFIIGSFGPTFFLDRMGRRLTLMLGCTGLGMCMMMIAALLSQSDPVTGAGKNYASASVAFFFLYMLIFGGSVNCVPWVYVPEILPLGARTKGTAIGVSSNWLWNFTIVMITPVITKRLAWKAYLIFMCTNWAFVPLVYFFFPETSNLSLEDIDYIFTRGGNPVSQARMMQKQIKSQAKGGSRRHSFAGDDNYGEKATETEHVEQIAKA